MKSIKTKTCPNCHRIFSALPENAGFELCSGCRNPCQYNGLVSVRLVLEPVQTLPAKAVKKRHDRWSEK